MFRIIFATNFAFLPKDATEKTDARFLQHFFCEYKRNPSYVVNLLS